MLELLIRLAMAVASILTPEPEPETGDPLPAAQIEAAAPETTVAPEPQAVTPETTVAPDLGPPPNIPADAYFAAGSWHGQDGRQYTIDTDGTVDTYCWLESCGAAPPAPDARIVAGTDNGRVVVLAPDGVTQVYEDDGSIAYVPTTEPAG